MRASVGLSPARSRPARPRSPPQVRKLSDAMPRLTRDASQTLLDLYARQDQPGPLAGLLRAMRAQRLRPSGPFQRRLRELLTEEAPQLHGPLVGQRAVWEWLYLEEQLRALCLRGDPQGVARVAPRLVEAEISLVDVVRDLLGAGVARGGRWGWGGLRVGSGVEEGAGAGCSLIRYASRCIVDHGGNGGKRGETGDNGGKRGETGGNGGKQGKNGGKQGKPGNNGGKRGETGDKGGKQGKNGGKPGKNGGRPTKAFPPVATE